MKSGVTTRQAGSSSTPQRVAPVRTTLVVAGIIVGLLVVAIVIFERGPARDSAPDNAEPDREASSAREASDPPAPPAMAHGHAAQPALPRGESAAPAMGEGRRSVSGRPEVKRKLTQTKVQKYAHEAYRAWLQTHAGDECPHLADLVEYTEDKDPRDAWGHPMKVRCRMNLPGGAKGIEVVSLGRDAEESEDDIKSRSWE
jgi:hypothetical protein